jgi:hypothetical protein
LIMNATVLKADLCSSLEVRLEFFSLPSAIWSPLQYHSPKEAYK